MYVCMYANNVCMYACMYVCMCCMYVCGCMHVVGRYVCNVGMLNGEQWLKQFPWANVLMMPYTVLWYFCLEWLQESGLQCCGVGNLHSLESQGWWRRHDHFLKRTPGEIEASESWASMRANTERNAATARRPINNSRSVRNAQKSLPPEFSLHAPMLSSVFMLPRFIKLSTSSSWVSASNVPLSSVFMFPMLYQASMSWSSRFQCLLEFSLHKSRFLLLSNTFLNSVSRFAISFWLFWSSALISY
jgi:hypothetical protein